MRLFECRQDAMPPELPVASVSGPSAQVLIRASGTGPCLFDLLVREPGREDVVLSASPGGYLLTVAARLDGGTLVVCASRTDHTPLGQGFHRVDAVTVECGRVGDGAPDLLAPVVVPEGDYAAWVRDLAPDGAGAVLTWARDFSFQFLNLTDAGRPAEDGIYRTELSGGAKPGATTIVSAVQNPLAESVASGWEPTQEEKEDMAGTIDFDPGPCTAGCSEP